MCRPSVTCHTLFGDAPMAITALAVEELAPWSEDEVRAHPADGKLVEGLKHMSPEYLKWVRRIARPRRSPAVPPRRTASRSYAPRLITGTPRA
jgi:hypothetical protein